MLFYRFAIFYLTGIISVTACATTKSAITKSAITKSASDRAVAAHLIFGDTYAHTPKKWQREFELAAEIGVDALLLDIVLQDPWAPRQLDSAFNAATNSTTKIAFSFDFAMADWTTGTVISTLQRYTGLPGYFRYQGSKGGGKLVSTFDGPARLNVDWPTVKAAVPDIYVVPNLSIDEVEAHPPGINGAVHWNAWPSRFNLPIDGNVTTVDDHIMQNALGPDQAYGAQLSPWFFTNYHDHGVDKEWVFPSNSDHLLIDRWQQMLGFDSSAPQAHVDILVIYSWNDCGECTYINDIGAWDVAEFSGGDGSYCQGFKHDGWRLLMEPFITAFKAFATALTTEHILTEIVTLEHRPYLAKTLCSGQSQPVPGSEFQHDVVALIGQTKSPVQLVVTSGATSTVINFGAGLSTSKVPMQLGQQKLSVTRNGKSCGQVTSSVVVTDTCSTPNYNANVEYILLNC